LILVIIYILTIFFGKDYFSISQLGVFFTFLGIVWLLFNIKKFPQNSSLVSLSFLKKSFQPIILTLIGLISSQQESFLILKSFPLTLSSLFFLAFIYAQITHDFFLIKYIGKFKKLDRKEEKYLQKTHLIWIVVTGINVALHSYFLFYRSTAEWTFYSTIGWYILLASGILFQILFRRFYERQNTY
jgi:hypothetical protein